MWRWHFYAGLFCVPFVLWLAFTGSIYLWKLQVEALIDRPYDQLAIAGPRASAAAQVAAAVAAVPGAVFHKYELPQSPGAATRVIVARGREEIRVYVHPGTLAILKTVKEEDRLMRLVFQLHGELMMGERGSYMVELAASWAIVMILTGLYLWWPRGATGLAGVLYPRWRAGGRLFWRDLHAVAGIWVSAFALFLLISGLPWAASWGSYLKAARSIGATTKVQQDWAMGGAEPMLGDHIEHGGMNMAHRRDSFSALDRIVPAVMPLKLASPVTIAPPMHGGMAWTVKSDAANRPRRTSLTVDSEGRVLSREDFHQRRLIDRIVAYGIAAHEGQLFGLANQLLGLFTAICLMLISISSAVLWWRRRPGGVLGAPIPTGRPRLGAAFAGVLIALGLLLPLLGLSLIAVLAIERLLLRRLPATSRWLGLRPATEHGL